MAQGKGEKFTLIYVSIHDNRMNMYDVKKMHEISISSSNVSMEYSTFLAEGNEQASFWKSVELFQGM